MRRPRLATLVISWVTLLSLSRALADGMPEDTSAMDALRPVLPVVETAYADVTPRHVKQHFASHAFEAEQDLLLESTPISLHALGHRCYGSDSQVATNLWSDLTGAQGPALLWDTAWKDSSPTKLSQYMALGALRVSQQITLSGDRTTHGIGGTRSPDASGLLDTSIYFATLVVIIAAFMLQGIRMWLSQMRQDCWATIVEHARLAPGKGGDTTLGSDLDDWWRRTDSTIRTIDWPFGIVYSLLLFALVLSGILRLVHRCQWWLGLFFTILVILSGVALILAMLLLFLLPGGKVERKLRDLQLRVAHAVRNQTSP